MIAPFALDEGARLPRRRAALPASDHIEKRAPMIWRTPDTIVPVLQ
jgi:hypothetical protein